VRLFSGGDLPSPRELSGQTAALPEERQKLTQQADSQAMIVQLHGVLERGAKSILSYIYPLQS